MNAIFDQEPIAQVLPVKVSYGEDANRCYP
jgi:hypothetical protein